MPEPRRHLVVGTAGHIDHGKTSLVKALTGVDTDRLAEEKRRGITIELGFAPWRLSETLEASIIDVPGHERLVRTMVAGTAGMDVALLVVAADDGVMPQTREHLDVLRLLAVPAGVLVLTKCDLVAEDLMALVEEDLRATCAGTVFADAPLVRTSSRTGLGLDALRARVLELAGRTVARPSDGPAFLPLDRVFTKAGYGTVVTGTLLRGRLRVGDPVEAWGESSAAVGELKVRGLQALGSDRQEVVAGMRTAVNLVGREVDRVGRGMVLSTAGAFAANDALIAWLEVLAHAEPLGDETLTAHLGTGEREARVLPLGAEVIAPGAAGGVLLRFDRPAATYAGQRLVLRRPGVHGQATVAGGAVLDPEPPRGKGAVSLAAAQVEALRGEPRARLVALARESRAAGLDATALHRRLPPGEGRKAIAVLERGGQLERLDGAGERWITGELAQQVVGRVLELVRRHHEAAPLSPGLAEAEVQSQLPAPEQHLVALAVRLAISAGKLTRDGALLALPGRGSAVDAQARAQLTALAEAYREAGLMPPGDAELGQRLGLERKRLQELLGLLRRQGTLVRVNEAMHADAAAVGELSARVIARLTEQPELTAPAFKELAGGLSRKWAIPLLEYLDRCRVTVRVGDVRRLHPSRR